MRWPTASASSTVKHLRGSRRWPATRGRRQLGRDVRRARASGLTPSSSPPGCPPVEATGPPPIFRTPRSSSPTRGHRVRSTSYAATRTGHARRPRRGHRADHGRRRALAHRRRATVQTAVLHAVSRHGRLPQGTRTEFALAAIPDITDWGDSLRRAPSSGTERHLVERHARPPVTGVRRSTGCGSGSRSCGSRLDRARPGRFLARDAGAWNVLRHRMAPSSEVVLASCGRPGGSRSRRSRGAATPSPCPRAGCGHPLPTGTQREVGWVVNCTGPRPTSGSSATRSSTTCCGPRGGRLAVVSTAGMGFRTDARPARRLRRHHRGTASGRSARCAAASCGSPRPCRRSAARRCAARRSVLDAVAPLPRRLADGRLVSGHHPVARPRDPLGLPLSTTAEAAAAYNAGLERVMRLQAGGEELIREADRARPRLRRRPRRAGDAGPRGRRRRRRAALARRGPRARSASAGDARERSLVDVVGRRVDDVRHAGAQALMAHIASHPRDVLAVSAAVPTIAFSGVTDVQQRGVGPGRRAGSRLRRPLVVHLAARVHPPGPGPVRRGRPAGRERAVVRAVVGSRGPCADPRAVRDRSARDRPGLARPLGQPRAAARPATGRTSRGTPPCTSSRSATPKRSAGATTPSSRRRP